MSGRVADTRVDPISRRVRTAAAFMIALSIGFVAGREIVAWSPVADRLAAPPSIELEMLEGRDIIERTLRLAPVLERATPQTLGELRRSIDSFSPGPQEAELVLFAEWWARFDPEAALDWARAVEKRTGLPVTMRVYRTWARSDPYAALESAEQTRPARLPQRIQSGIWQDPAVHSIVVGWNESELPGLVQWVLETPDDIDRQGLMNHFARERVASRNAEEVWSWAASLPNGSARQMLPRIASALAARDPEAAVRLATPHIERGEFSALPTRIATRWVKRDPIRAFEWLRSLPGGKPRQDAVLESARTWIGTDRAGFVAYAEAYVDAFPKWLEPALELLGRVVAREGSPERGLAIVGRLGNERRRLYNSTLILRAWHAERPQEAEAWMDQHDVPADVRRRARSSTPRPPDA